VDGPWRMAQAEGSLVVSLGGGVPGGRPRRMALSKWPYGQPGGRPGQWTFVGVCGRPTRPRPTDDRTCDTLESRVA
jgi:hypothetical protein